MRKNIEKKEQLLSVVSIDTDSKQSYQLLKNEIKTFNLSRASKKDFCVSYLYNKDVLSGSVEINRGIPESDIADAIEIKSYEELNLDTSTAYKIAYFETTSDSGDQKNRVYNVFAVDTSVMEKKFLETKSKVKYIDYITVAPFLVKSLYEKNILVSNGVECFIYFQKKDAFLTIYRDGEYIYSRSVKYSLIELCEKFSQFTGERIEEDIFFSMLSTSGIKVQNSVHQQYLMDLFSDIFLYINDILVFAKRSYALDRIDKVYLGSEIGIISGLNEYAMGYLGVEVVDFNFNIAINLKDSYVDQMHVLMLLSAQSYIEERDESFNFSIFRRPPPLKDRPVGKLFFVMAIAFVLGIAYPLFNYGAGLYYDFVSKKEVSRFQTLSQEANNIRSEYESIKNEMSSVDQSLNMVEDSFKFKDRLVNEIYAKKIAYNMKSNTIIELSNLLDQNNVKINKIVFNDNFINVDVVSYSEKRITKFIKDLTELGGFSVSTKQITKDSEGVYLSTIDIEELN